MRSTVTAVLIFISTYMYSIVLNAEESDTSAIHMNNYEKNIFRSSHRSLNGRLTTLWAQEYIGSDLSKEFISHRTLKPVYVGVVEGELLHKELPTSRISSDLLANLKPTNYVGTRIWHGALVTNLIVHPTVGSSQNSILKTYIESPLQLLEPSIVDKISASNTKIINFSMRLGWDTFGTDKKAQTFVETINKLVSKGVAIFFAAGNEYPYPLEEVKVNAEAIVVGDMDPIGLLHNTSREGLGVDLVAPAGISILSAGKENLRYFGWTSAATPLVSGIAADILSILPGITPQEIEHILKNTALQTLQSKKLNSENGVGLLNAYKAIRVADRLSSKWPENRDLIISANNTDIYHFSTHDEKLDSLLNSGLAMLKSENLDTRYQGLQNVRKVFFLTEDESARSALVATYRSAGYSANATFYQSIRIKGNELSNFLNQTYHVFMDEIDIKKDVIRASSLLGSEGIHFVDMALQETQLKTSAINSMTKFGKDGLDKLKKLFTTESDPDTKGYIASRLMAQGHAEDLEFIINDIKAFTIGLTQLRILQATLENSKIVGPVYLHRVWNKLDNSEKLFFLDSGIAYTRPEVFKMVVLFGLNDKSTEVVEKANAIFKSKYQDTSQSCSNLLLK